MKASKSIAKVCTMERSTDYCKIPSKFNKGGYKWPSLIELHVFLFKTGFDGAHNAGADVTACRVCFLELVRIGEIRPSIWRT